MSLAPPVGSGAAAWRGLRSWLRRGLQVLLFCALMVVLAFFIQPLKRFDWWVAERLAPPPRAWPAQVELIDLNGTLDPLFAVRERTALRTLLCQVAALPDRPAAVLLSFALPPWPGEAQSALTGPCDGRPGESAFQALAARGVALMVPPDEAQRGWVLGADDWRERSGDAEVFGGVAQFGHGALTLQGRYYWYSHCGCLGASCDFPALAVLARRALLGLEPPAAGTCDDPSQTTALSGDRQSVAAHRWRFDGRTLQPEQAGRSPAEWSGRVLVLGHLKRDRIGTLPRAELLGWAIGDGLPANAVGEGHLRPLDNAWWAVAFALAFSALAAASFELLSARLHPLHRWLHVAAVGAALTAVGALALTILLLDQLLHLLYFQVIYVLIGIALATWLSWRQMASRLRDQALYTDVSRLAPGDGHDYDVFVSYSHTPRANIDWVREQVVAPLQAQGLRVFFDERSIRVGTAWYFELASGIQRSRCMVAICSDDYFAKGFCRFELSKAMVREIGGASSGFKVLPYLSHPGVNFPVEFNHVQYASWVDSRAMLVRVLEVLDAARAQP
ncbi:toll/interleukin-1 receptor domain-containing protein [Ideonella sp. 4Y16]|uniref:Toll/interleukin-1 receptor domain-containing protein n=1 Tax=Ideonella alba TaxID=2824118 RepID=A0A940YFI6_9BURK|nr:toll/interleukin-1 receptor domain-containing protein [Ideonella alba]MBQ0932336.1 toll/interleukin-1 receptor domain-containing protein [Ideonella alba]MBQ0944486.1 toll/interleukin-1 receptor domain-containing protein [Ideonella alba]